MSGEIQESGLTIGGVDYAARVFNAAGQIWNASTLAYETYNSVNLALYGADAGSGTPYQQGTEVGSIGRFRFDTAATSPRYYEIFEQAGASPAESDTIVAAGTFDSADIADIAADVASLISSSGTGARTILVTVTDGSDPLENVTVRFTEGATTNVAKTNASGERSFGLDDATWDYAVTKAGYTGVTGTHVVNSSETPLNIELTLNAVTPPTDLTAVNLHVSSFDHFTMICKLVILR